MARYDDSAPYTPDYEDDCSTCGREFPRGELAWNPSGELECADCEHKHEERDLDATIADGNVEELEGIIARAMDS